MYKAFSTVFSQKKDEIFLPPLSAKLSANLNMRHLNMKDVIRHIEKRRLRSVIISMYVLIGIRADSDVVSMSHDTHFRYYFVLKFERPNVSPDLSHESFYINVSIHDIRSECT